MGIGSSGVVNCANTYLGTANYTVADGYVADRTVIVDGNGPAQLNLNFTRNEVLDPRITFSRTSNATRVNAQGLIETVAVNQPRFDYDPVTLAPKGLLIEEQRVNSIRNNTMQGAVVGTPGTIPTYWIPQSIGGVALTAVVGVGTESGITYVDVRYAGTTSSTTAGAILFESTTQISAASGQTWTGSFYVKLVAGSLDGISTVDNVIQERSSTGALLASTNTQITPTNSSLSSQRVPTTRTLNNALTAFVGSGVRFTPISGVAIDFTLRIGLPQLEQGAFPTSVIPTTTTQVTRTADNASMVGTNFSSWYNQSEGTVVAEFDSLSTLTAAQSVAINRYPTPWHIEAGTSDTNLLWYGANAELYIGGSYNNIGNVPTASFNKFAAAISSIVGNSASSLNAGNAITRNGIATGTATSLGLGSNPLNSASTCLNGHLKSFKYFNKRLLNSYLQSLTQ